MLNNPTNRKARMSFDKPVRLKAIKENFRKYDNKKINLLAIKKLMNAKNLITINSAIKEGRFNLNLTGILNELSKSKRQQDFFFRFEDLCIPKDVLYTCTNKTPMEIYVLLLKCARELSLKETEETKLNKDYFKFILQQLGFKPENKWINILIKNDIPFGKITKEQSLFPEVPFVDLKDS